MQPHHRRSRLHQLPPRRPLLARGDSVILLDNLSTGRLENIEHLRQRDDIELVLGSILNADVMTTS